MFQFVVNDEFEARAQRLWLRLHRKPWLDKATGRPVWFTAWVEPARIESEYVYVHGPMGTALIRLANHPSKEFLVIYRKCRDKFFLDTYEHPMTDDEIVAFLRAHLVPYGTVADVA